MSKEDKPPPSPNHGIFDPTGHLLGSHALGLAGLPFSHLAHLPTFPWLARPPFPPALFGGLGALPNPLLAHALPPTTGGADWWRAASEHARRVAGSTGVDFFAGSLGLQLGPSYGALGLESPLPGFEFLLSAPSDLDKSLFGLGKHITGLPSASTASPPKRSRSPTPAPAHQKSSSKSSYSSSSSSKDPRLNIGYPPNLDGKSSWHINGSTYDFKNLSSQPRGESGPRKRRHRSGKQRTSAGPPAIPESVPPVRSTVKLSPVPASSSSNGDSEALNLTVRPASVKKATSTVTPGVQDLSVKKPAKEPETTNGNNVSDTDSPDVSSPGSDISDDSDDGNHSDGEKGEKSDDRKSSHQIDVSKRQLLADQIRQQLMGGALPPPHHATPLVIPSLPLHFKKQKEHKKSSHSSNLALLSLANHYNYSHLDEMAELLGQPSSSALSSPYLTSSYGSFLSGESRSNHLTKDESRDSLPSHHTSEADDSKFGTSGSDKFLDSESQSGWGSEDDESLMAGSSTSPGPSNRGVGDSEESSPKRRNIVLNEKELIIPLEHGWRRQTTIHGMGRRGIVGEVTYYAPCNKKMKTIPDVLRYLERNSITDLSRENFTFNTKVNIGQFFEIRDKQVVPLTEIEVAERIAMSKGKRARMQMMARKRCDKHLRQQSLAKQAMEAKLKRRMEQQDMARKAAEMKFQERLEKERQKEMAKKVREVRLMERKREKERARMMKQQEKIRQQEQLRLEREMRAQQIVEARRRRQMELEEMRMQEVVRKSKSNLLWLQMEREREMKKQQHNVMREQEKERRRQHLLLVKALEQRKKQEEKQERERVREEKMREKNIEREKKLAQRQMELFIAREMKKPLDDMELRNVKPLPKFPRCPEAKLPGPAFSDCLMIIEFINNFADALGLDPDSLPTLDVLQNGLLNSNDEDVEEVVTLYLHLLRFALDDIGVPNPREAMTMLNQKITDLEITDATMSEVTRLFLRARGEKKMSEWLEQIPLEALNPTKKAAIIAFLCNELLSSKILTGEIEKQLEAINTLRRDKWIVEGKLRKLRTLRAKKFLRLENLHTNSQSAPDEDSMTSTTAVSSKVASDDEDDKDDEEEEEEEVESCDESDATNMTGNRSEDEDEGLSREDMDKKIEKLVKQHNSYDSKVVEVSKHLRGTCLGQDRYKRIYWILPSTGGIFIEGIESGETEALKHEAELFAKQKAKEAAKTVKDDPSVKSENLDSSVKSENMNSLNERTDNQSAVSDSSVNSGDHVKCKKNDRDMEIKIETKLEVKKMKAENADNVISLAVTNNKLDSGGGNGKPVYIKSEKIEGDTLNGVCSIVTQAQRTCNETTSLNRNEVSNISQSQAASLALLGAELNKTDSVKICMEHVKKSANSSLLFQEPILTKFTDLLKTSQREDKETRSPIVTTAEEFSLNTTATTMTPTLPKVAQTISSTATTILSSTPISALLSLSTFAPTLTASPVTTKVSLLPSPVHSLSMSSSLHSPIPPSVSVSSELGPSVLTNQCAVTPPSSATRKTFSSTSTTILSSTPVSLLPIVSGTMVMSPPLTPVTLAPSATSIVTTPENVSLSVTSAVTSVALSLPVTSSSSENIPAASLSSTPIVSFSSHSLPLLGSTVIPNISSISSPVKVDKKSNFISIDALLKKETDPAVSSASSSVVSDTTTSNSRNNNNGSNNHFLPVNLFPPSPLISEHFLKSYADILDQKPWFSILPRIPCDETSLTRTAVAATADGSGPISVSIVSSDNIASASLSLLSLLPMHEMQAKKAQAAAAEGTKKSHSTTPPLSTSHSETQTKSMLAASAASFQAYLSQSSVTDSSLQVSLGLEESRLSASDADSFKVPAPPADWLPADTSIDLDPTAILQKVQGERLPIPLGKQRGWWKISDAEHVRQLHNCCLSRGVREKNLSYAVRKHMDFICQHICTHDSGKSQATVEEKKEEKCDNSNSEKTSVSVNVQTDSIDVKVKEENSNEVKSSDIKDEVVDDKSSIDSDDRDDAVLPDVGDSWNVRVGFEVELACLEDVEALEDRIFNASLQMKCANDQGWKLPPRATDDFEIRMVDRSVKNPEPPDCYPTDVARERLLFLESNIERRYLKPPLMRNVQLNLANIATGTETKGGESEADGSAKDESGELNEDVPPGLLLWRRAVQTAQTPAQLNLCTQLLGNSIAWEKSIMKVTCQICLKDDNEAELLLCDGCDKGYHTYCFKPKMEAIPDGDWYCYECVSKASGVAHCIVCGGKTGKMVECEKCPRAIHTDCLDPPLPRMPKKWQCASCISSKNKKASKRKRKESATATGPTDKKDGSASCVRERKESESVSEGASPEKKKKEAAKERKEKQKSEKKKDDKNKEKVKEKKEKKEKPKKSKKKEEKKEDIEVIDKEKDSEMVICGKLLSELEKNEDGWPFKQPVNTKKFPSYKKYIKQPMDFTTMRNKLRDNVYKTPSEFATDIHLILNNCETFNEDDSEVGQAGHNLRRFFTQRWCQFFGEDS